MLGELGNRGTVAESSLSNRELAAGAVALDASALLVEGNAAGRGILAVDFNLNLVSLERHRADELVGLLLCKRESTSRLDVVFAANGEVVGLGNVKGHFDRLSGSDVLEGILSQVLSGDTLANTVKSDDVLYG